MINKFKDIFKGVGKSNTLSIILLLSLIIINIVGFKLFYRFDLTSEKRYSLSPATKSLLSKINGDIQVQVYLEGEFPAGFKHLRNEIRDMLNEFKAYNSRINFEFINPSASNDKSRRDEVYQKLISEGLMPTDLEVRTTTGMSRQIIFPGAIIRYNNKQLPVNLLKNQLGMSSDQALNNSIEQLEYTLGSAFRQIVSKEKMKIAFLKGHGELNDIETADARQDLSRIYDIDNVRIGGSLYSLMTFSNGKLINKYKTIVIAKPDSSFSEADKYCLDRFVTNGGSLLCLINPVFASMDSIRKYGSIMATANELNLDDLFFTYGARLNKNLVIDLSALPIPVVTGYQANQPQTTFLPWLFFPVITPTSKHIIVKNLNPVKTEFVSSIDTVENSRVKKTILLSSSRYSRVMKIPMMIAMSLIGREPNPDAFANPYQDISILLEGKFESLYQNRSIPSLSDIGTSPTNISNLPSKIIIISDGDIIRNQVQQGNGSAPVILPLGYDRYTGQLFGNKSFILNALDYLSDNESIIEVRSKTLQIRKLDPAKLKSQRVSWQVINLVIPVFLVILFGILMRGYRKRRFAK